VTRGRASWNRKACHVAHVDLNDFPVIGGALLWPVGEVRLRERQEGHPHLRFAPTLFRLPWQVEGVGR
jgi:hypothetical protein